MMSSNGNIFSRYCPFVRGHSLVSSEFPAQRPVTRSFDVFFDPRLNKRLGNQSWCCWFETLSIPLWRQCSDLWAVITVYINDLYATRWKYGHAFFAACDNICCQNLCKETFFNRVVSHLKKIGSTGVLCGENMCACGDGGPRQGHNLNALLLSSPVMLWSRCFKDRISFKWQMKCLQWFQ